MDNSVRTVPAYVPTLPSSRSHSNELHEYESRSTDVSIRRIRGVQSGHLDTIILDDGTGDGHLRRHQRHAPDSVGNDPRPRNQSRGEKAPLRQRHDPRRSVVRVGYPGYRDRHPLENHVDRDELWDRELLSRAIGISRRFVSVGPTDCAPLDDRCQHMARDRIFDDHVVCRSPAGATTPVRRGEGRRSETHSSDSVTSPCHR